MSKKTRADKRARTTSKTTDAGARVKTTGEALRTDEFAPEISETTWRAASLLILAGACVLRLYDVSLTPLHHDEGVNGFFLTTLVRSGIYHYDPANYHGPVLYYFALVSQYVFGLNTFAIRFVPAMFGVATIWLVLCLRKQIGTAGALIAAALIAVSPGAVYMSRYFIHESLFVFFTLGLVVAALRYYETTRAVYLLLASISAALLFATKETAIISAGVLVIALIATRVYGRLFGNALGVEIENERPRESTARFGGASRVALLALIALAIFVFVNVLFYSSFFTYAKGVTDALATFKVWAKTGTKDHVHVWSAYLSWLWQEESLTLLLGVLGAGFAALQARNRFAVFAASWAIGILSAYSLVPYKTPWLALNFIVPLAIVGGYGINEIYRRCESANVRAALLAFAGICVAFGLYQALSLNFRHYDDDTYPYVYAHTRRETVALVAEIEKLARRAPTGTDTSIAIASPDYWPLPWYLRDYKRVGYHVAIPKPVAGGGEPIVIGSETQEAELRASLGDAYARVGSYVLRPGVNLVLYARRDLLK
ncbi:MAG: flippase activity-associated protein Agl23 [Pyrinomonadaceae bacterium]